MKQEKNNTKKGLPESFRPLLWSYNFDTIDRDKHKKQIIVNTINYGDLKHWKWIQKEYGEKEIQRVLTKIPVTEMRKHVRKLVSLLFNIPESKFNYAQRGAH